MGFNSGFKGLMNTAAPVLVEVSSYHKTILPVCGILQWIRLYARNLPLV